MDNLSNSDGVLEYRCSSYSDSISFFASSAHSTSWLVSWEPPTPTAPTTLTMIYTSAQRLINLVSDMLNISRIEGGRFEIHPKPMQLVDVASEVLNEMLPTAQAQGITLTIKHIEWPIQPVLADADRIKEVLINLIGNALKFTPQGGSVTISFANNDKDKTVAVSVEDTGKGIRPEDMPHLFQKFGMIEGNYLKTTIGQGTGLGLYLSKAIVEMHGGSITVFSEGENKGTTFTFTLKQAV